MNRLFVLFLLLSVTSSFITALPPDPGHPAGEISGGTFVDDGTNDFVFPGTRNVGIGVAVPNEKLDIAGTIRSNSDYSGSVTFTDGWAANAWKEIVHVTPTDAGASGLYEITISGTRNSLAESSTYIAAIDHANPNVWREAGTINDNSYVGGSRCFTVDVNGEEGQVRFRIRALRASAVCGVGPWDININFKIRSIGINTDWTPLAGSGNGGAVAGFQPMGGMSYNLYMGNPFSGAGNLALSAIQNGNVGINKKNPLNKLEIDSGVVDSSGLRFTQLTTTTAPVANPDPDNGVLGINVNGDVILVTDQTGGVTGEGTATRVAFWNGAVGGPSTDLTSSANLFWDDMNSRLGIGTGSPNTRLEIDTGAGMTTSGLRFTRLKSTNAAIANPSANVLSVNANGDVIFVPDATVGGGGFWAVATDANDIMNTNSGDVGIGTNDPGAKLDIAGVGSGIIDSTKGIRFGDSYSGITPWNFNPGGSGFYRSLTFYTTGFDGTNVVTRNVMTIGDYGGNVGIGLITPGAPLDVKQNSQLGAVAGNSIKIMTTQTMGGAGGNNVHHNEWRVRDAAGNDWNTQRIHDAISVDASFWTPGADTRTWWERDPSDNIQSWGTGASTYLTIKAGNVGINRNNPATKLEIDSGAAGASGLRFTQLTTTTAPVANPDPDNGVLGINVNGDVILVTDQTAAGGVFNLVCGADNYIESITVAGGLITAGSCGADLLGGGGGFWAVATDANDIKNTNSGDVGIGTNDPLALLHIKGNLAGDKVNTLVLDNQGVTDNSGTAIYMGYQLAGLGFYGARILQRGFPSSIRSSDLLFQIHDAPGDNLDTSWYTALKIQRDGNVGIGTTNPLAKLHVDAGDSYFGNELNVAQSIYLRRNGVSVGGIWTGNNFFSLFGGPAAANHMVIKDTGNVGIGYVGPNQKLEVGGAIAARDFSNLIKSVVMGAQGSDFGAVGFGGVPVAAGWNYYSANFASQVYFASGGFQFRTAPVGVSGNPITWTVPMIIQNDGKVGIGTGTTAPNSKLEVSTGSLGLILNNVVEMQRWSGTNSNGNYLDLRHIRTSAGNDYTTAGTRIQQKIDATWMGYMQFNGNDNTGGISFGTGTTLVAPGNVPERMRIDSAGHVMIGTTTPNVGGYAAGSSILTMRAATTAGNPAIIELLGFGLLDESGSGIDFYNYASSVNNWQGAIYMIRNSSVASGKVSAGKLVFYTSDGTTINSKMVILGNGSIGVGKYEGLRGMFDVGGTIVGNDMYSGGTATGNKVCRNDGTNCPGSATYPSNINLQRANCASAAATPPTCDCVGKLGAGYQLISGGCKASGGGTLKESYQFSDTAWQCVAAAGTIDNTYILCGYIT